MRRVLALLLVAYAARAAAPPRVLESFITTSDGVRLFVRRVGSGPQTVVYLHGGPGGHMADAGYAMEPLAANRTLVLYDQRGSGRSDLVSDPKKLTAARHVADLEELRQQLKMERMSLIGFSWGSGLAALYASKYPKRVERILFLSPMPPAKSFDAERTAAMRRSLGPAGITRRGEIASKMRHASDAEVIELCRQRVDLIYHAYVAHPESLRRSRDRCDSSAAAIRNARVVLFLTLQSLAEWDFRPLLKSLAVPALVVEGAKTTVPLDATREWARVVPRARLLLIPDAGHANWLDQPEAFRAAAETFLRGEFPAAARSVQ
ncbi:MAG: alpha/beta fold hydrolase [Acidobacteria bacterium]|nr:alpha/beta fold hydrolase [Acidobacteriota bacterium]MBV9478564.1 alpha/beta fold hydrolase [Acidobacteriota bacterium]